MKKLIIKYHWSIEYVCDSYMTLPVEYESKTALQVHILDEIKKYREAGDERQIDTLVILGHDTGCWLEDLDYFESQIDNMVMTVEEWFEKDKLNKE